MKNFYFPATLLALMSLVLPTNAQTVRCGTLPPPAQTSTPFDVTPLSATVPVPADQTILIPVVVHVVWNAAADNITDAQVCSQIQVMNEDFARLNADRANTPGAFQASAANPRIQFYLATRDPAGNATNGITRTQTATTVFRSTTNNVKSTAQGGRDGWDPNRYLNVWVCGNLRTGTDQLLYGYSTWPAELAASPNLDGVVVWRRTFGRGAGFDLDANLNLGRTATHEVGHWLDLIHIWGDDGDACTGTDQINDTPNQANSTFETIVPVFPRTDACSPNAPGIMFMNYMDYSADRFMNMFTNNQTTRMRTNFDPGGFRQNAAYAVGVPIEGPAAVCANATYSVPVLPPGLAVTWASNNAGLSINAATGAATRQNGFNGGVTLTASIGGCGNAAITRSVWVGGTLNGASPLGAVFINGPLFPQAYTRTTYSVTRLPTEQGMLATRWEIPPAADGWRRLGGSQTSIGVSVGGSPGRILFFWRNECSNVESSTEIFVQPVVSFRLAVFPNPADGQLNVQAVGTDPAAVAEQGAAATLPEAVATVEADVRLLDAYGQTVRRGRMRKGRLWFDTADLRHGLYYLRAEDKETGFLETRQVLVSH